MKNIKQKWKEVWLLEIQKSIKEFKNPKTRYRQIPNVLTASRLLSPFVIIPIALSTNVITTFIVASLFALTDAFDGKIARKYNIQSKLGTMLDPVTDKLFALGLLIPNIVLFPIITTSIIALEGLIGIINSCSALKENNPCSNMLGKTKTTFVSITAIAMYITNIPFIKLIFPFLAGTTFLLQASAAITYKVIDRKKDRQKQELNRKIEIKEIPKEEKKETIIEYSKNDLKQELLLEKEKLLASSTEDTFKLTKNK